MPEDEAPQGGARDLYGGGVTDAYVVIGDPPPAVRVVTEIDRETADMLASMQRSFQTLSGTLFTALGALTDAHRELRDVLIQWQQFNEHVQARTTTEELYARDDKMPQEGPPADASS